MHRLIVVIGVSLQLAAIALHADIYKYHPSTTLHLGGGFDPSHPSLAFPPCLEWSTVVAENGSSTSRFDSQLLTDTQDLYQSLQVDAILAARYLFLSATASFHLKDESAFHSDS